MNKSGIESYSIFFVNLLGIGNHKSYWQLVIRGKYVELGGERPVQASTALPLAHIHLLLILKLKRLLLLITDACACHVGSPLMLMRRGKETIVPIEIFHP